MKSINCKLKNHFTIQNSKNVTNSTNRIKKISDTNYKKANLQKITSKLKYLSSDEQLLIFKLHRKHENMFDGTLGYYTDTEYKIELLKGAQLYHTKSFQIPKLHEETLKTEVNTLVNIGILKYTYDSEWDKH